MNCKWRNCNGEHTTNTFTDVAAFREHVSQHFELEITSQPNHIEFRCPWSNCEFELSKVDEQVHCRKRAKFSCGEQALIVTREGYAYTQEFRDETLKRLWTHVNFHVYHEVIKHEGDKLFLRKGGGGVNGGCLADPADRDLVMYQDTRNPDATEPFTCCWNGCGDSFNYLPDLISHV